MADSSKVSAERMYRDDGGAALERAARLEDENRRLRSEVERLRASRGAPEVPSRSSTMTTHSFVIGVATATTCLGMALVFLTDVRPHHHHAAPPPAHTVWQVTSPPTTTPQFVSPTTVGTAEEDCKVPFWFDANHRKHYKLACIK